MTSKIELDVGKLRQEVQIKYAQVATHPRQTFHFHTGRPLAERLGYPEEVLDKLPDQVVESFAGVGNPFSVGAIGTGEKVLDVQSGAGFDSLIAAQKVGPAGQVIGVDMTREMLDKATDNARLMSAGNVEFRMGYAEELPVEDGSVDVVVSNGVINLCPDKERIFREVFRVLKPGGRLMLADITVHKAVPDSAKADIDLWTG